jgi:hypothetical protein
VNRAQNYAQSIRIPAGARDRNAGDVDYVARTYHMGWVHASRSAADRARARAIEQDPTVIDARLALGTAGFGAAALKAGPHEW